jgi:hypothetical protein
MSLEAMAWAWKQETPNATAKLVLLAIADHANGDGLCWPSMIRIAAMSGVSTRQVSTHVSRLVELGLLAKADRRRSAGRYRGWTYHVPFDGPLEGSVDNGSGGSTLPATGGSTLPVPPEVRFRSEPLVNRKGEPSRPSRKRDLLFEALADVGGHRLETLTRSERGRINAAAKDLREAGATPEQVERAAAAWRRLYPSAQLTVTALAAHWSRLVDEGGAKRLRSCPECGGPLDGHTPELCDLFRR